jgi:hypothetical protein
VQPSWEYIKIRGCNLAPRAIPHGATPFSNRRFAERSLMFLLLLALTLGVALATSALVVFFFVVALIAFAIIRRGEVRHANPGGHAGPRT